MNFNVVSILRKSLKTIIQPSCNQSTIGFIGLGNMGAPMALNLLKKDQKVFAYDVVASSCNKLSSAGATICSSPMEVASNCDKVITMLPNVSHVQEVYLGENGILKTVKPKSLLIDSSTIDPSVSKQVAAVSESKFASFMDAPVSGGVPAATAGTLTFMVGGQEKKFEETKQILQLMGQRIVHCGSVGAGQAAKLCNNMLLATSMIATAESMNMGINLGLDPKLLAEILSSSTGRCWSVDTYNPVPGIFNGIPSSNNYDGGFGSALMLKDLLLCREAAKSSESDIQLAEKSIEVFEAVCKTKYGLKDFSSVYQYIKEQTEC